MAHLSSLRTTQTRTHTPTRARTHAHLDGIKWQITGPFPAETTFILPMCLQRCRSHVTPQPSWGRNPPLALNAGHGSSQGGGIRGN